MNYHPMFLYFHSSIFCCKLLQVAASGCHLDYVAAPVVVAVLIIITAP